MISIFKSKVQDIPSTVVNIVHHAIYGKLQFQYMLSAVDSKVHHMLSTVDSKIQHNAI